MSENLNFKNMTIKDKIKAIAATACPAYSFVFDTAAMFNVTADNQKFPCIYMDEYYSGRVTHNHYRWQKTASVELHFMKLATLEGAATTREDLREDMETNAVVPFIAALNADSYFAEVTEYRIDPEPPLFDANAVGLLVSIDLTVNQCNIS